MRIKLKIESGASMATITNNRVFLATCLPLLLIAAASIGNAQTGSAKCVQTNAGLNGAKPSPIANPSDDGHLEFEKDILSELRQIRLLLAKQQQPQQQAAAPVVEKATVSTAGYELGRKDAPLTLVEFADYQCPFCKQFQSTVFRRLKKEYIDTGKLRFVSRDLPLDMHPNAFGAAQAARCAGEQDKFWEMRDTLIAHSDNLAPEAVGTYANQLGLDMERFHSCVDKGTYLPSIRQDIADATSAGISGTPAFVIGRSSETSVEGTKVVGAQPYESFEKILADYPSQQLAQK